MCEWAVDDLGGEGANRTSGPNGLDLFSDAGRGCLLEHDHIQPSGRLGQRRAGDAVAVTDTVTDTVTDAVTDAVSDRNTDPDPQSDDAGHGQGWPGDDAGS